MFDELIRRKTAICTVSLEATELCKRYKGKFETNRPEIISSLQDYARKIVKIELKEVIVWDNESISMKFGKFLP
jgi:hypothetical protein